MSVIFQKTIRKSLLFSGIGLHHGNPVSVELIPAAENTGIYIRRAEKDHALEAGRSCEPVPMRFDLVSRTTLCTEIRISASQTVKTIEHLSAALRGSRARFKKKEKKRKTPIYCFTKGRIRSGIDNVGIIVHGDEIPIMDGSCSVFASAIESEKVVQSSPVKYLRVKRSVKVNENDGFACLNPSDGGNSLEISYELDYSSRGLPVQRYSFTLQEGCTFNQDVALARTFCFESDILSMKKAGLIQGGSLDNAIVLDSNSKPLGNAALRYPDEMTRHKLLDCIGDLGLADPQSRLVGKYEGYKSGHGLNNRLLHKLFSDPNNYELSR